MGPPDDSALLRQYAENHSEEAFAALVARHINLVYSVALRQNSNPHHAEEITQAVFVRLAQKAPVLRHDKALGSWLFQATRLTASNFVRSEIRRQRREQEAYMQIALDESENNLWEQIAPLLDMAVAGLSETDRRAILLRFYEGRTLREIGVALGANEDTARKRVTRAVEKLQQHFQKRGVHSPAEAIMATISLKSVHAAPVGLAKAATVAALAKGAATSISSVTVIKGALKIMAWTKTQTAVAVAVAVFLATGTTAYIVKETFFPTIQDVFFQPNYGHFQSLPRGLFTLRPTHFTAPAAGVDYSGEASSPSGEHVTLFMGRNRSFEQLIAKAYGGSPGYIVFPSNLPTDKFDYLCTILDSRAGEHLQAAIKRKLGYTASWQSRDTDVLLLEIKPPHSPLLKPPGPRGNSVAWQNSETQLQMRNRSLASLAYEIQNVANIPILDQTLLPDAFDFDLNCARADIAGHDWESVNTALGPLGLELVPTNMPMNMLVVEKAK